MGDREAMTEEQVRALLTPDEREHFDSARLGDDDATLFAWRSVAWLRRELDDALYACRVAHSALTQSHSHLERGPTIVGADVFDVLAVQNRRPAPVLRDGAGDVLQGIATMPAHPSRLPAAKSPPTLLKGASDEEMNPDPPNDDEIH